MALLLFLTTSSILWHTSSKDLTVERINHIFWIDQVAIWSVAIMSIFYAFQLKGIYAWLFALIAATMVGLAMYILRKWWDNQEAQGYHSALHVAGVLGAHCILLGSNI